jgi:hypothetical protein
MSHQTNPRFKKMGGENKQTSKNQLKNTTFFIVKNIMSHQLKRL